MDVRNSDIQAQESLSGTMHLSARLRRDVDRAFFCCSVRCEQRIVYRQPD